MTTRKSVDQRNKCLLFINEIGNNQKTVDGRRVLDVPLDFLQIYKTQYEDLPIINKS